MDLPSNSRRPTTLILARHGETPLNVRGQFRGRADPSLTPHGVQQAIALAQAIAPFHPEAVVASPRRRAAETAREVVALAGRSVVTDPRIDDIDYGAWTGMDVSEVGTRWADLHTQWLTAPDMLTIPGGEAVLQVSSRMSEAMRDWASRFGGSTIVLVTHDVTIRLAICAALEAPLAAMHRIRVGLASITVLTIGDSVIVERVNDEHHHAASKGGA